jgi:hypothetical protein
MITVTPNPVKEDGLVKVNLVNQPKGVYRINLINTEGQVIFTKTLNHVGGNSVYEIILTGIVAHGNYIMRVSEGNNVKSNIKIVY